MYRALIVEDEDLMRDYLAATLNTFCPQWIAASTAADGLEAIEKLAHERFDAVITDIRMPGMDGIALSRYIRKQDVEMPILILSGYDEFDYARSAMRLNVFDYLLKPLNEGELTAALSAMAAQVAKRQEKRGGSLLALALEGGTDAASTLAARYLGKACALMLLAPAYTEGITLNDLFEAAGGLGELTVRLEHTVAILITAPESLLLNTAYNRALDRLCKNHPSLHICSGSAPLDWGDTRLSFKTAKELLQLALALNLPFLKEPLQLEQRQAASRLEAMQRLLYEATADGQLTQERCAVLAAALKEFPQASQASVAAALLNASAGASDDIKAALQHVCTAKQDDILKVFSAALRLLGEYSIAAPAQSSELVWRARDVMQTCFAQAISLSSLAEQLGVTPAYLSSIFHREMGCSYSQYLLKLRMEDAARRLLENPNAKVNAVGAAVGFPSAKHFAHVFRVFYHTTPKEYRDKAVQRPG